MTPPKFFRPSERRLFIALVVSLVLHVSAMVPFHFPAAAPPLPSQIYIQANLQPLPNPDAPLQERRKEKTQQQHQPQKKSGEKAARLASDKGNTTPIPTSGDETPSSPKVTSDNAQARIIEQPAPPEYPAEALRRNLEGCVLAAVTVSPGGDVEKVEILAADFPGIFDQSVITSQEAAKYLPARQNGDGVESRVLTVAAFVLEPGKHLHCAFKYAPLAEKLLGSPPPTSGGKP